MRIYKTRDYKELSRKAADIIAAQVILNPESVLGLATGSSPVGAYRELIERCKSGSLDFSAVTTVNLDEYAGLGPEHPQSYRRFMRENLFDHVNIKPENTYLPDGLAADPQAECDRYEALLSKTGGIDLQLLGLGHNGHIGFNEPDGAFPPRTNYVALTQSTIDANKRFFESESEVPRHAFTMGIGSIMRARHILIIVSGKEKAGIVKEVFSGPVTPKVPGSALQLHNNVTLVGDDAALSAL
ncbi:MAG: glucosamine-6-phosphate deaminase [Oscillospiraceae bacterium]|jgi:glucosamine-6-phosphate deaminase|nr:glucosamine-6-phosphate deaminase [Oscillospiraceae bacterium]